MSRIYVIRKVRPISARRTYASLAIGNGPKETLVRANKLEIHRETHLLIYPSVSPPFCTFAYVIQLFNRNLGNTRSCHCAFRVCSRKTTRCSFAKRAEKRSSLPSFASSSSSILILRAHLFAPGHIHFICRIFNAFGNSRSCGRETHVCGTRDT